MLKGTQLNLILLIFCFFMSQVGFGQVKVNTDNSVRIGGTTTTAAKLYIENVSKNYGLDILSTYTVPNGHQYGIRLNSTMAGNGLWTGRNSGIHNTVEAPLGSTGSKFGFYNVVSGDGATTKFGIYNSVSSDAGQTHLEI